MMLTKKTAKMFTLIEVMIVLAIIGIIAGIGVPQFKQYQDAALAKKRLLNIETWKTAMQSYCVQFDISNVLTVGAVADWENSKGQLLVADLGLNMVPYEKTDLDQTNLDYSVFDFIKGASNAMKVAGKDFRPPTNVNRLDISMWANPDQNDVNGNPQWFYVGFSNSTGLAM